MLRSKFLQYLLSNTENHHPACGCTPCVALSGWSIQDEKDELIKEMENPEIEYNGKKENYSLGT